MSVDNSELLDAYATANSPVLGEAFTVKIKAINVSNGQETESTKRVSTSAFRAEVGTKIILKYVRCYVLFYDSNGDITDGDSSAFSVGKQVYEYTVRSSADHIRLMFAKDDDADYTDDDVDKLLRSIRVIPAGYDCANLNELISIPSGGLSRAVDDTSSIMTLFNKSDLYDFDVSLGSGNAIFLQTSKWWFFPTALENDVLLASTDFTSNGLGSVEVALWQVDGNSMVKVFSKTVDVTRGDVHVPVNFKTKGTTWVAIHNKSTAGAVCYTVSNPSGNNAILAKDYTESDEIHGITPDPFSNTLYIPGKITTLAMQSASGLPLNVLTVGPGMQFSDIQGALDSITDSSPTNAYTVLVFPKGKPYGRFSTVRDRAHLNDWSAFGETVAKYVSIIGVDKRRCVVRDDTGNYRTPPAEITINGSVENLTFISTHDSPNTSTPQGGYAVHIDNDVKNDAGYKMVFRNCDFTSYTGPAVGIGLHQDADLSFVGCNFYGLGSQSYTQEYTGGTYRNICNLGALFCHPKDSANTTGQHITLDGCNIYGKDCKQALQILTTNNFDPDNCKFVATLLRNMTFSESVGTLPTITKHAIVSDGLTVDKISYANSQSDLNKLS